MNPEATTLNPLIRPLMANGAETMIRAGRSTLAVNTDLKSEYEAAKSGIGIHDRSYRGLLEITGADRISWLNNLLTQQVKTLEVGQGCYSFAVNIKGRILFDLQVLVGASFIRLDIDRLWVKAAVTHFERYIITEDVQVADRTDDYERLSLCGPRARDFLAGMGAAHVGNAAKLQHGVMNAGSAEVIFFRDDFCGPWSIQWLVRTGDGEAVAQWLASRPELALVGLGAVDALRIEAGIPWPMSEINDEALPAETGRFAEAVSTNKGCYLGQEIVERMRSRKSVARLLVSLEFEGPGEAPTTTSATSRQPHADLPQPGDDLCLDGQAVGRVTSAGVSPQTGRAIGLGYVRAGVMDDADGAVFCRARDGEWRCRMKRV